METWGPSDEGEPVMREENHMKVGSWQSRQKRLRTLSTVSMARGVGGAEDDPLTSEGSSLANSLQGRRFKGVGPEAALFL